jgi:hypothetical protein
VRITALYFNTASLAPAQAAEYSRRHFGALQLAVAIRLVIVLVVTTTPLWAHHDFWLIGDANYYYSLGTQSDAGFFPFLNYWMEYPPIFPLFIVGVYRTLAAMQLQGPSTFIFLFQGLMSIVDIVNLVLLYHIVRRASSSRAATTAALVYAASPLAVYFSLGWYDPLAVLLLLAGLYLLIKERPAVAGAVVGLGILVKLFPGVVLLAVPFLLSGRRTLRFCSGLVLAIVAVLGPLALLRFDLLVASFGSMLTREPWESVTALLSGSYGFGSVSGNRFDAASAFNPSAYAQSGFGPLAAPVVFGTLTLAAAVVASRKFSGPRHACLMTALGLTAFVLGNKGFSPQFACWLLPIILLAFPDWRGLVYASLLTICMVGYYAYVHRAMVDFFIQSSGTFEVVVLREWIYVLSRTLLLGALALHLLRSALTQTRTAWPHGPGRPSESAPTVVTA